MIIEGSNGTITLENDRLRIRRKGIANFLTQGIQGEKTIPFTAIRAVQFKDAGSWMAGYIQFTLAGAIERAPGILEATKDENAVLFEKKQQPQFDLLRQKVEQYMKLNAQGTTSSVADQLEKLASLLDKGLLTREEFESQKMALLSR